MKSSFSIFCLSALVIGLFTFTIDTGLNESLAAKSRPKWVLRGDHNIYQFRNDRTIMTQGAGSLRLSSDKADLEQSALVYRRKGMADFRGRRVRLTGDLRTENLQRPPMMFAQVISQSGRESQSLYGWSTTAIDHEKAGWQQATIILDIPVPTRQIIFGFQQYGSGTTWGDNFQVEVVPDDTPLVGYNEVHRKATNTDLSEPEPVGLPLGWETRWTENCDYFSADDRTDDAETAKGVILKWRCPNQKSAFFYQNVSAHHYLGKPASVTVHAEFDGELALQAVLESSNTDGMQSAPHSDWSAGSIKKTCIEMKLPRKARRLRYGVQFTGEGEAFIHSVVLASHSCKASTNNSAVQSTVNGFLLP